MKENIRDVERCAGLAVQNDSLCLFFHDVPADVPNAAKFVLLAGVGFCRYRYSQRCGSLVRQAKTWRFLQGSAF